MSVSRSLSKHIRDPDKVDGLWKDKIQKQRIRSKKREKITLENLFSRR